MTEQSRQPAGTPTGGQFSASARPEANISLDVPDGSYPYPPTLRTPEEAIAFWSRVPVPDEALAACERTYTETREKVAVQMPEVLWETHGQSDFDLANPRPDEDDTAALAAWEGKRQAAQVAFVDGVAKILADRPERLNRRDIRPVVRAMALYDATWDCEDPADRAKILNHLIDTSGGPRTVRAIAEVTGLSGVSRFFLNPDLYQPEQVDTDKIREIVTQAVSQATREQKEFITEEIDGVRAGLRTVGEIVIDNT